MIGYMKMAYECALTGPDTSTQNGAVLTDRHGTVIGLGKNDFPHGVKITPERLERPAKYSFTEHAERNAIFDAAANGNNTQGSTMYALWAACDDCARAIIQAGVSNLVTHSFYRDYQKEDGAGRKYWGDSISAAFMMLEEAGVGVEFVDFGLGMTRSLLYNGEEVRF